MDFLHTGDLHFGGIPAIGKITEFGMREREYDLIRALSNIKSIARSEVVDTIIIAGDIFNTSSPDSTSRVCWSQFLISLIKGDIPSLRKVYIVLGNHDCPNSEIKADALEVDEEYVSGLGHSQVDIQIASTIRIDEYNGHGVILVPHSDNPDHIRSEVLKIYGECENRVNDFILVGHIEINEAELGANDTKLKSGFSYKDEIFSHKKLRYAALGHIHKPQQFLNPDSAAPIVYCGSPVSKDFNEAADWRRVIIGHANTTGLDHKEIELPDRDFITITNGEGLDDLNPDIVKGSIIKLKFKGNLEFIQSFNCAKIVSRLEEMGALQVKIDRAIMKEIKDTDESEVFRDSASIPSACKTYIERFGPKELNKDKLLALSTERIKRSK